MMTTSTPSNGKNQVWNTVKWIAGICIALLGLVFFSKSFVAGLMVLFAGLLVIPVISEKLKVKFPVWEKRPVRIIVPVALFLIGAGIGAANTSDETTEKSERSKAGKEQKASPYQAYLDGFKTVELSEDAKERREEELAYLKKNEYCKMLIDSAIVSEKYIPIMQAIAEGVTYSHAGSMAMTTGTLEKVKLLDDEAVGFADVGILFGMPEFGGYTKEQIEMFERYRKKYGYYQDEATTYRDKNGEWQTIEPFDFSPIFAVLDPKNPKVLDALYEARKKGVSFWAECDGCFYPYITSKRDYIEYIKQVYPKSPYIPKWNIEISARDLYVAYDANEVSADNQYKGKLIAVTGTIEDISKDIWDNPCVKLNVGEYFSSVNCSFSDKNNKSIGQLSKNQKVTIVGKCDGFLMKDVRMKNCEVWEE